MSRTLILLGKEETALCSLAKALSHKEGDILTAALSDASGLNQAIRTGAQSGTPQIVLIPCVVHLSETDRHMLSEQIENTRDTFPNISVRLADPIGYDPRLADILIDRADQAGLDEKPNVPILTIEGLVPQPVALTYKNLCELPGQIPDVSHLAPGRQGTGIQVLALLNRANVNPEATHVIFHATDDAFSADVRLDQVRENGFFIYQTNGRSLPPGQGGPLRLLIPGIDDRCANVKNVVRIELIKK
ncbi:MAG: molybdopterin-dependent oxidoreductase [bacterium]|nr:molybdopterin-dependent oxidoreductase [bacterium]